MIVNIKDPETGEEYTEDIESLTQSDLDTMNKEYTTEAKVHRYIENLDVSADIKAILFKLSKFSIAVGKTALKIGKKILEIAIMLISKFKIATFGLVVGALLTLLIGSIPLIGAALATFLGPLLLLFGLGRGLWEDLKKDNPNLATNITNAGEIFAPLKKSEMAT
jgi:hypothetical protein